MENSFPVRIRANSLLYLANTETACSESPYTLLLNWQFEGTQNFLAKCPRFGVSISYDLC